MLLVPSHLDAATNTSVIFWGLHLNPLQVLDFLAGEEYAADKFLLAQNRPRKVMNNEPREQSLAEAGFGKRELLFIEER